MTKESLATTNLLRKKVKHLEEELNVLRDKNRVLEARVASRRYKLIDSIVDSSYSGIRKFKSLIATKKPMPTDEVTIQEEVSEATDSVKERSFVPRKVDIVNINFFDWEGKTVFKGGAERYVYDLARLLKDAGFTVRIIQCSNIPFTKTYRGIEVVGLGLGGSLSDFESISRNFNDYCADCEFVIASPLHLACAITDVPVIGINHGIDFDGPLNKYNFSGPLHRHDDYMRAMQNVKKCVCVDTIFINWVRTQDYDLSLKCEFVPNYYYEKQFTDSVKSGDAKEKKVRFVYPRRLYSARGYDIAIEAFGRLLEKDDKKISIRFVGQVHDDAVQKDLSAFMERFSKNVSHAEYPMNEMSRVYEESDVVIIPTRFSEGTSLSCIEAMASGKAIIATNVGGLGNLIINGFNGLLIEPTADALEEAVSELVKNPKRREMFAKNARLVAESAFGKKIWDNHWKNIINSMEKRA